ncbi:hypothetical protein Dsin_005055 [Dipteronia sinensis]|uniref:F-box protein At3g26010-like beta-propeller domain-containing protein n=1 Tax=Dipteronia sinensis TaxID=43782 RepID=A0AAE0AVW9_9ROSI|nr:hypothetical protein Dsin_005055 [Dipteronia sinensis]
MVVCDGIMYWMSCGKKREIVAYDPLNDTDSCRVIDSPDSELEYRGLHVPEVKASLLGVTGGRLRLLQYVGCTLWVWELEDYNQQAMWICRARIYPIGLYLLLGFHPYDPDQVYLTANGIVLALHVPTRISRKAIEFYHDDNGLTNVAGTVFQLVHPWWPTPVPPPQS